MGGKTKGYEAGYSTPRDETCEALYCNKKVADEGKNQTCWILIGIEVRYRIPIRSKESTIGRCAYPCKSLQLPANLDQSCACGLELTDSVLVSV